MSMRATFFRTTLLGAALGLALITMPGCASQLDALAPVGGDDISMVRTAATTLLLAHDLEVLDAPKCTKSDTEIACVGSLVDGSEVTMQAPTDPFGEITVTVGGEVLFQGQVASVIDKAAQGELP